MKGDNKYEIFRPEVRAQEFDMSNILELIYAAISWDKIISHLLKQEKWKGLLLIGNGNNNARKEIEQL